LLIFSTYAGTKTGLGGRRHAERRLVGGDETCWDVGMQKKDKWIFWKTFLEE